MFNYTLRKGHDGLLIVRGVGITFDSDQDYAGRAAQPSKLQQLKSRLCL